METSKVKSGIIALLLIVVGIFTTSELRKPPTIPPVLVQDTMFLNQWKNEKLLLVDVYEAKIGRLQQVKDSLWFLVSLSKTKLTGFRAKASGFQHKLKEIISRVDSIPLVNDSISPILDSLIITGVQIDTACDLTISTLENIVANRDSSIIFQKQVEENLKEIQKEQDLRNKYLAEQLTIAFNTQKRKTRQNKFLAAGILFLTGIFTAVLIPQLSK